MADKKRKYISGTWNGQPVTEAEMNAREAAQHKNRSPTEVGMDDYADKAKARMTGQATIVATTEDEEKKFQAKIRATPWFSEFKKKYGEEPNLSSSADYDYRKAVKGGAMPQRDKHDNDSYHWPSALPSGEMLKSKDHPTVWKEHYMRATGKNPDDDGVTEAEWKKTLKGHKKGGVIKSSASSRADGIAQRGKTRGKIL